MYCMLSEDEYVSCTHQGPENLEQYLILKHFNIEKNYICPCGAGVSIQHGHQNCASNALLLG